ncbi:primosomal protein N' [soil metagenome]
MLRQNQFDDGFDTSPKDDSDFRTTNHEPRTTNHRAVADVALDPRDGGSEAVYTYLNDGTLKLGDAVMVPLAAVQRLGYVVALYEATEGDLGFPFSALKKPTSRIDGIGLPRPLLELARKVAEETLSSLPVALGPMLPPGVRERLVGVWRPKDIDAPILPAALRETLRTLKEAGEIPEKGVRKPDENALKVLKELRKRGLAERLLRLDAHPERRTVEPTLRLTADVDRIESFMKKEGKRRPAQALTVMRLQDVERPHLTGAEIRELAGVTEATLRALRTSGILEEVDADTEPGVRPPEPNPDQKLAIEALTEAVNAREARGFLLFGVTGSGKTEVYLRAATEALRMGRQALILVPEIALATQQIARLRERFGRGVAVLHSNLSSSERLAEWARVRSGEAAIVLGARSAVFAPLTNLGLVVIDEEHEGAYKQESAPRYQAVKVATELAKLHGCPWVQGSATPSLESWIAAEEGEEGDGLTLLSLPRRTANAKLPDVQIEDLTSGYRLGSPGLFAPALHDAIEETLDRGEQTILFLNRRAYAPFVICRDCGYRTMCPNCSVALSYHRRADKLRCHQCGHHEKPAPECPQCHGLRLAPFGVGAEKVEDIVRETFPTARVARLDRDVAQRKGALEEVLSAFRTGALDILVGTQMVAKGLDFPNVTLVGVIAADISLNLPDFRASERTFQLLSQVSGRAGRGQRPGRVFIQTFNPKHPSIVCAANHDPVGFLERLAKERKDAGYPPFRRIVNVILSGESRPAVVAAADEAATRLKPVAQGLLGPTDCVLERVQNRWRRHILLKLPPHADPAPIGRALLGFAPKGVQVVVDVDPYSMM